MPSTPRFCRNCGAAVRGGAQFCGVCGATITPPAHNVPGNEDQPTAALPALPRLPSSRPLDVPAATATAQTDQEAGNWKLPVAIISACVVLAGGALGAFLLLRDGHGATAATQPTTLPAAPAVVDDGALDQIPDPAPAVDPTPTQQDPARQQTISDIKSSIQNHWALRAAGDTGSLSQAYAYYTGELRRRAGTESKWIAGLQADGLFEATVGSVRVTSLGRDTARATAEVRTNSAAAGCKNWVFRYDLIQNSGGWQMSRSTTDSTPC